MARADGGGGLGSFGPLPRIKTLTDFLLLSSVSKPHKQTKGFIGQGMLFLLFST